MSNFTIISSNSTSLPSSFIDIAISFTGRFWMILISNTASIGCSLFVLYHMLSKKTVRHNLHNHAIIIILILNLICECTDIPWFMYYFQNGVVWLKVPIFCRIWIFIDSVTYVLIARLVAWASIERHILIFHEQWVSTRKKRFFVHYIPIGLILAYTMMYYIVLDFIIPCNILYNYFIPYCNFLSCAYTSALSIFEFSSSGIPNSAIIAFFSAALVFRVMRHRVHLHQQIHWRKYRKMTIQIISITALFYIFYLPLVLQGLVVAIFGSTYAARVYYVYGVYLSYYINFLLPFVSAGILPDLRTKVIRVFCFCKHGKNTVKPEHLVPVPTRARTRDR